MPNYYDDALQTLTRMNTAAEQLDAGIRALEAHMQQVVVNAPLTDHSATPAWVLWANALRLREKHAEWGRKLHGVIMGYAREMDGGWKNLKKNRNIGFGEADVTVGTNEPYAKAVQYKHTVSPENSAVNEMIAKAANQLTGESGEKPLATQRKIIDVMINDPRNWWPFDLKDFKDLHPEVDLNAGIIPFAELKARGAAQILAQLGKYKKGRSGLDDATRNSFFDINPGHGPLVIQAGPSGPRTTSRHATNGQKLEFLTIKMVYGHARNFADGPNTVRVSKIVFAAFRQNGALSVHYLSHS